MTKSVSKSRRDRVGSRRVCLDFSSLPSMTKQSFKDECDINSIMAKFERTGQIEFVNDIRAGKFIDLTDVDDYHTSLNKVFAAQQAFDALPSKVRSYFENDPSKLLDFIADPKNVDKAVELGLATKRPPFSSPHANAAGVFAGGEAPAAPSSATSKGPSSGAPPSGGTPNASGAPSGGASGG